MPPPFRHEELEAYLDEALPVDEMARIEAAARADAQVQRQLASIHARRDAGVHSLGEIWRRHRLSCPTREQLGSYVLGTLERGLAGYVTFHVEAIGCRLCQASLADLRAQQSESSENTSHRRQRYFQSSAGYLRRK